MKPEQTDEQLILDGRSGSNDAFAEIFARYRVPVWQFFRRRVSDAHMAEELAQDTFVAILGAATRYEARGSFRSYVYGIAFNILNADLRRSNGHSTLPLEIDPPGPPEDHDAALWVRGALARLEPGDRDLLMLREFDQLSYQEIAAVLNVPLNTVRSRLFRARMAVKILLEERTQGVRHEAR